VSVHEDTYSTYKLAQVLHGMTQENWCIEGSSIHLRHSYIFATSYNKLQKIIELVLATVAQLDTIGEHKHNRGNTTWLH